MSDVQTKTLKFKNLLIPNFKFIFLCIVIKEFSIYLVFRTGIPFIHFDEGQIWNSQTHLYTPTIEAAFNIFKIHIFLFKFIFLILRIGKNRE